MPLVSVVIPTHNRPEMLAEALASIKAQTFTDYEIVVVSNGESPEMRAQSHAASALIGASWFSLDDGNVSVARNFGVARATGEWIAFLDDDDIWLPEKLERQAAVAAMTGADVITADWLLFYPDGHEEIEKLRCPTGWSYTKAISHYLWGANTSLALIRKSAFDDIGGFDECLLYSEDMDLWRRLSWRHTIHQTDDVLVRLRQRHRSAIDPAYARKRARVDLQHFDKMHRDTPAQLRCDLPSFWFAVPRFVAAYGPDYQRIVLRRPLSNVSRGCQPSSRTILPASMP
jgi:glycosyltransferase involved in cell wall biosynthesis